MALDGTYAGLQASIAGWLNRRDLTAVIPDFITLAEAQINRRLRVRRMITSSTATIVAEFISLPADFAGPLSLVLADGTDIEFLTTDALVYKKWQLNNPVSQPRYAAVVGTELQFLPAPDVSYAGALLTYYQMVPPLASNETNWLLAAFPDAYLYGALVQAAPYLKDDSRLQTWGSLFTTALTDIEAADRRESYGRRLQPTPQTGATP